MDRIVLIGQAPGPNTSPAHPLFPHPTSSTGGRLAAFLGLSAGEYLRGFERYNLLNYFPGQRNNGQGQLVDAFPRADARAAAQAIWPFLRNRRVIFVGRLVQEAFELETEDGFPFLQWTTFVNRKPGEDVMDRTLHSTECAVIPHPSGRNPWWAKKENREAGKKFVLEHFDEAALVGSKAG